MDLVHFNDDDENVFDHGLLNIWRDLMMMTKMSLIMDFLIYRHILSFCPDHTEANVWTQLVLKDMSHLPILLMTSQIEQRQLVSLNSIAVIILN